VRVQAAHDHEHGCHDSSTLCKGCTHSPWVTIILCSQAPIDSMECFYTILVCALGYHYKAFQYLLLICTHSLRFHQRCQQSSSPRTPSCVVWFSRESIRSQPDGSVQSPLYPLHQLVCQTSLYHILHRSYPYRLMVVLFLSMVSPWTGTYIWVWWLPKVSEVHRTKPWNVEIHWTQFHSIFTGKYNNYRNRVTTWYE
jgi:hypothetical protein